MQPECEKCEYRLEAVIGKEGLLCPGFGRECKLARRLLDDMVQKAIDEKISWEEVITFRHILDTKWKKI